MSFKFLDYDCIGFDLDNTVAKYRVGALMGMEYDILAKFMVDQKGYSSEYLTKPIDRDFLLKGLIVDCNRGNVIRIAYDGTILSGTHGTTMLTDSELVQHYPEYHWEASDVLSNDPLQSWNDKDKMYALLDYFDVPAGLVYARAVDSIEATSDKTISNYQIWSDILDGFQFMYNRNQFRLNQGSYYPSLRTKPEEYYHKCSEVLLNWLRELREQGKILFLITGSHVDAAALTASNTIGPNWRDFFDIVVTFAKKPGFFTEKRDFLGLDEFVETEPVPFEKLQVGGIYTHGNWGDLQRFLSKRSGQAQPKFLYVGDNLVQDIYTTSLYSDCDTVTVCEELQAEGKNGTHQKHPDEEFLVSLMWGSYFYGKETNIPTNWCQIMKDRSKICIPSLEYVANFSLDHSFDCSMFKCD